MTMKSFVARLSRDQRQLVTTIRTWITEHEGLLRPEMGEIMGTEMLMFKANGGCKYGFTLGKYLTFHNWVMYCNPEIRERYANDLGVPKSRVQKSCINLSPGDMLNEAAFSDMFAAGAAVLWTEDAGL